MDLIVHVNEDGLAHGVSPFAFGSSAYTQVMKTEGLRQALDKYKFDAAFGGARRDEARSCAKERIFSHRTVAHAWDPKNQRPELWRALNTRVRPGESMRVFPLSNWTERKDQSLLALGKIGTESWLRLFGQLPADFKWISAGVC